LASVEPVVSSTTAHSDLKAKTLRGGLAKLVAQFGGFALRVGSLVVLARLLDPHDFGLVGMVTVVTGVFSLFRDAGLGMVTVQSPTITREQISTLFWINLFVGFILAVLTVACAPIIASFYGEPRLFLITVVLATGFLFNSAGVQHLAVLQRHMRFGWLAVIDIVSLVASVFTGLAMAWLGAGYWALVGMAVVLPGVSTLGAWAVDPWLPGKPRVDRQSWSMIRFGGSVTLNVLIVYIAYNTDKLLLGRFWGADALGVYGRAYQLVSIPNENLHSAVSGVAVSALSRIQDDAVRFKNYFLRGYSLFLAVSVPITLGCTLFADDIIAVVLGPRWSEAVPIFRFLAPTITAFALINPLSWLLFSTGRIQRSVNMAFVIAPVVIAGYTAGLAFGPQGIAVGYSAMMMLLVVPMALWALHGTTVSPGELFVAAKPPFLSAIAAVAVGFGTRVLLGNQLAPFPKLVVESAALFGTYGWTLLYVGGQWHVHRDLFRQLMGKGGA
jgi:PST family polysaccharide transporter